MQIFDQVEGWLLPAAGFALMLGLVWAWFTDLTPLLKRGLRRTFGLPPE